MKRAILLFFLVAACGGKSKPETEQPKLDNPPPAGGDAKPVAANPDAPSREECDQLLDHAFDLMDKAPPEVISEQQKQQIRDMRKTNEFKKTDQYAQMLDQCTAEMTKTDLKCGLTATDIDAMNKCGAPEAGK